MRYGKEQRKEYTREDGQKVRTTSNEPRKDPARRSRFCSICAAMKWNDEYCEDCE